MKTVNRTSFWHYLLFLSLSLGLLTLSTPPTHAQTEPEPVTWLEADRSGLIQITQLIAIEPGNTPMLNLIFKRGAQAGDTPFEISFPTTTLLSSGDACDLVLRTLPPLSYNPQGETQSINLPGYCLQIDEQQPPIGTDYYPPTTSTTDEQITTMLSRVEALGLTNSYAVQLVIWQYHHNLTDAELADQITALNLPLGDISRYADDMALLRGETPPPTPTSAPLATNVPPTTAPATSLNPELEVTPNAESTPPASPDFIGILTSPYVVGSGVFIVLALIGAFILPKYLNGRSSSSESSQTSSLSPPTTTNSDLSRNIASPPPLVTENPPVQSTGPKPCPICGQFGHITRDCRKKMQRTENKMRPLSSSSYADPTLPGGVTNPPPPRTISRPPASEQVSGQPVNISYSSNIPYSSPPLSSQQSSMPASPESSYPRTEPDVIDNTQTYTTPADDDGGAPTIRPVIRSLIYRLYEKTPDGPQEVGTLDHNGGMLSRTDWLTSQHSIPDKDISSPHALLVVENSQLKIKDLNSLHGTRINGNPVQDKLQLIQHTTKLQLGRNQTFTYNISQRQLIPSSGNGLAPIPVPAEGERILLTHRHIKSLPVNNKKISNPHLLIRPTPRRYQSISLRDLNSSNGTTLTINDEPVKFKADIDPDKGERHDLGNQVELTISGIDYILQSDRLDLLTRIGRDYRVEANYDRGGMCDIYRVIKDGDPDRKYIAKVPYAEGYKGYTNEKKLIEQLYDGFKTEIDLFQKLTGENHFVKYIDAQVPTDNDPGFLIMDYIPPSCDLIRLQQGLRNKGESLRLSHLQEILDQLLNALQTLHETGYIHADLKPGNILLDENSNLYLIDLGVARRKGQQAFAFKTDGYAPPEVLATQELDERADIFGFGRILLNLLIFGTKEAVDLKTRFDTGSNDFAYEGLSPDLLEVAQKGNLLDILQSPESRPYATHFAPVIAKCLHTELEKRYQTLEELREDLGKTYSQVDRLFNNHVDNFSLGELVKQSAPPDNAIPRK